MSGPRISIVPEDSQRVINMRPNVNAHDIRVQHSSSKPMIKKVLKRKIQKPISLDKMSNGSLSSDISFESPRKRGSRYGKGRPEFPNVSAFDNDDNELSDSEKEKVTEELKKLGYI